MKIKDYFKNLGLALRGSTPANPSKWLREYFGGEESLSGVSVNEETALKYSAVYGCVRILAETIASIPLNLYKRTKRGKTKLTENNLYNLLHSQSNEELTSFSWREIVMAHVLLWGNHYSQILRDGYNRVKSLHPLLPERMKPERIKDRESTRYNKKQYIYQPLSGRKVILQPNEILHIPGLSFDGLVGKSPLGWYREQIGLGLAMEEYSSRFFSGGLSAGGIFTTPKSLKQPTYDRLKQELKEKYTGLNKAFKTMVLEEDLKFSQVSVNPNDAQLLESKKFQLEEVARLFRVPLFMLQNVDRATFSNIEHLDIAFVVHTIRPWLVRIEQSLNMQLLSAKEKKNLFFEFVVDGLLRGDITARFNAYTQGIQNGIYSPNDILELENRNTYEGGDKHFIQFNMQPVEGINKPIKTTKVIEKKDINNNKEKRDKELKKSAIIKIKLAQAYSKPFENAVTRLIKRERVDVTKLAKKYLNNKNTDIFDNELYEYYEEHKNFVRKQTKPIFYNFTEAIALQAAEEVGLDLNLENKGLGDEVQIFEFMQKYQDYFEVRYAKINRSAIRRVVAKAIKEGNDPLRALEIEFDNWELKKPVAIATRETVRMTSAVSIVVYKIAGILKLVWRTTSGKSCLFCSSLDGKVVGIEKTFVEANTNLKPEGADTPMKITTPRFHPPLHDGCVCTIVPMR